MEFQDTTIAWLTLAVTIVTLGSMWYIRYQENRRLRRIEYCEHIKFLCSSIIQFSSPQSEPVKNNVQNIQSSKDGYRPPLKPLQFSTHGYISNDEGMINTTDYADTIRKSPIRDELIQHLYSFQKKTGNTIYDDYDKLIVEQKKTKKLHDSLFQCKSKDEEIKIRASIDEQNKVVKPLTIGFVGKFVTLSNKVTVDINPDFGYCMNCIDKFGFLEKRKYRKILDSFLRDT